MSRKHNKRSNKNKSKSKKETRDVQTSKAADDEVVSDTWDDEDLPEDEDELEEPAFDDEEPKGGRASKRSKGSRDDHEGTSSKRGKKSKKSKESDEDFEDEEPRGKRSKRSKKSKESDEDFEDEKPRGKRSKRSKKSDEDYEDFEDEEPRGKKSKDKARKSKDKARKSKDKGHTNASRGKGKGKGKGSSSRRDSADDRSSRSLRTYDRRQGLSTAAWVWITIAAVVVGMLLGRFVLTRITGGVIDGSLSGKTTVSADQLNAVMGTYTYKGQTYNITVQDVLDATSSQNQANSDGTYTLPSSDNVLGVARTRILVKVADDQGITVSDDEITQYAQQYTGTSDLDQLASNYGISADKVKQQVLDAAKISKLRSSVISTTLPEAPTSPTAPSDGNGDTTSKDYADYIINLAGSEWDANTGTWAATDGTYASALADYTITSDSASYNAAQAAYKVALQKYTVASQQVKQDWTNYLNSQLSQANIQLSTLVY